MGINHEGHSRGPSRVLMLATLCFVGIATYVLVVTHSLHIDSNGLHLQYHQRHSAESGSSASRALQRLSSQTITDAASAAAFVVRMEELGALDKYDRDADGKLSAAEFRQFLADLSRSKLLDPQVLSGLQGAAADLILQRRMMSNEEKRKAILASRDQDGSAAPRGTPSSVIIPTTATPDTGVVANPSPDTRAKPATSASSNTVISLNPSTATSATPSTGASSTRSTVVTLDSSAATSSKPSAEAAAPSADSSKASSAASTAPASVPAAVLAASSAQSSPAPLVAQECPELSKELVESFAVNNTIMLTVSDWRIFETFGVNWMKHLRDFKIEYYLVGATDKQTSTFLAGQGRHPCFKFFEDGQGHGAQREYRYGDSHYNAATWRKVSVVAQIVSWGFNVLHSDVDVVWFRDPLPYFLGPALQNVDIAVSTDLISTHLKPGDEGLEEDIHMSINVNTGVYFVKSSPGGKVFMNAWAGLRKTLSHDNDQVGLYKFLRNRKYAVVQRHLRSVELKADDDPTPIRLGMLGSHMLLNGYSYFIPQLNKLKKVNALGIHMTWVPLSREGKFHRMRDGMLYYDPPEYYSQPMYITADLDHPVAPPAYNVEQDTEKMIKFHLHAMDRQLVQMYRAMAMSLMLNRTLVFPKLKCFCYKNWFMSEQCRIPGDRVTQFPLDCALDQWLRPKVLYQYGDNLESREGRKAFLFREHTLLENPSFPKALLREQVIVRPGVVGLQGRVEEVDASSLDPPVPGVDSGKIKVVTLQAGMKEGALREAVRRLAGDAKILRIRKPYELFGGWDDELLKKSFETFLDKVAGNWCCRDEPFVKQGMNRKEKLAIHW